MISNILDLFNVFRIVRADGSILEGSDDDGESGADTVLLNVLRKANVTNQVVVVTRWFGGIEIGSDRFKHYRDAAHGAMVLLTTDKEEEAASKKGKKNKSKANSNAGGKSKKNK